MLMGQKYAGSEVLSMAVEIERKGMAFYENVAHAVKNVMAREVFQFLANEEKVHEATFKKMLRATDPKSSKSPYDTTEVVLYFRSLIDKRIFPDAIEGRAMKKELSNPGVATDSALVLEKDSILFYQELLPFTEKKDHKTIQDIIGEERGHISRILKLKKEFHV